MKAAYLVLENGVIFKGQSFGAEVPTTGEIVFTTAMTGYLETLTDPSYCGQIVLQTFPLIGNYGVIPEDFEAENIALSGYIVKYPCENPSNFRSVESLDTLLKKRGIAGLCRIDTRMLTKIIRTNGVMNGKITYTEPTEEDRAEASAYKVIGVRGQGLGVRDCCSNISSATELNSGTTNIFHSLPSATDNAPQSPAPSPQSLSSPYIVLIDYGAKGGIEEALSRRGCHVMRFGYAASAEDILSSNPCGIVLSNGPGDPADPANKGIIEIVRKLDESGIPILGICLGHQLLALAKGYKTRKMKFGHRGANQAVKEISTGRVFITSQNHGFEVETDEASFANQSYVNVNDGTNEGLDYGISFSVQFHPEAQGGPLDTSFLFDRFLERIKKCR